MGVELNREQIKLIIREALMSDPDIVSEVLQEIKSQPEEKNDLHQVIDELFAEYDDVFKALA